MKNKPMLVLVLALAAACTWSCVLFGCFAVMRSGGTGAGPVLSIGATETLEQEQEPVTPTARSVPPTFTRSMASATTRADALRTEARVTDVIDGDTIEVEIDGQTFRLRYIGMDAPEPDEPGGLEAKEANRLLVDGQVVELERDTSETDEYGRLLRYVYVRGIFVNARLVQLGYARAVSYPPDVRDDDLFSELEREAQAESAGLWAEPTPVPATPTSAPTATPTLAPATATAVPPTSTPVPPPAATPTAGAVWNCHGNLYNCGDFSSCEEVMSYWYACPGDPSRLDGDHDGRPCESLCR